MYLRVEKAHSFTLCCAYNHFFAPLVRPPYTPVSAECGHVITVIHVQNIAQKSRFVSSGNGYESV